jgi:uncharacterized SAM-dependent methyltransferase
MLDYVKNPPLRLKMQRAGMDSAVREQINRELEEMFKGAAYPDLAADTDALFARERAGHMLRHVFNDSSTRLFEKFIQKNRDYLASDEIQLIADNSAYLESIGQELRGLAQDSPVIMVELGTGKRYAQEFKTIPTVRAMRPDQYIGIDYAPGSALESIINVKGAFKKAAAPMNAIAVQMRIKDFMRQEYKLEQAGPRIFLIYGNTLANLEGFSDELPNAQMDAALANVRRHMNTGDYLLVGLQSEQKEDMSYKDKRFHAFHEDFLKVLKKGLHEDSNFKPEDFEFFVRWDESVSNHIFGYRAMRDGWVQPVRFGACRHYKEGQEFITCNSWRYSPEFLQGSFDRNGLALRRVLTKPQGQMAIHAVQAL